MKLGDVKITNESFGTEPLDTVGEEGTPEVPEGAEKTTPDTGEVQKTEDEGTETKEADTPEGEGEVEVPEESTTEITQAVTDASEEVAAAAKDSEDKEGAAEQFEKLADATESLMEQEGAIPAPTAAMITSTMESIHKTLGLEPPAIPSLEAFSGPFSKIRASTVTLESISDTAKKVWRVVIDSLKSLAATTIRFLVKLFNSRAAMEKHLVNLLARAEKVETKVNVPEDLSGRFVRGLEFRGESNFKSASDVVSTANWLAQDYLASCKTMEYLRNYTGSGELRDLTEGSLDPEFLRVKEVTVDEHTDWIYGALPNGMSIFFDKTGEFRQHTNCPAGIERPETMKSIGKQECIVLLKACINVLRKLREGEGMTARLGDYVKAIVKNVEIAFNDLRIAGGDKAVAIRNERLKAARSARKLIANGMSRNPAYIFSAVKHASELARRSIAVLEK